ncbi:MAG: acyl-CoA dehydrogenase family protein [Actinobacteria bacterium]|nr:acyl-CoA dehydrogenase family protein [Actinomycetota bacterium]
MDFQLSEELSAMQDLARDFAEKEIAPIVEEDEKHHRFRPEIVRKMGDLGFFGVVMPEEWGGTNQGLLASVIMTEEIARVSASYGLPFNMQTIGPGLTILKFGTQEQKQKYLPGLISGELFGCFAITEPNSGSDVASMKTTATEEDDCFVLNGQKMWISNADVADVGLVYAHTDRSKGAKGMSCFVVDLKNTPGITAVPIEGKVGLWCAPAGEIIFEDARIPKSAMLGEKGEGFKICMWQLDNTRMSCATRAVGVGRACIEASVKYANERTQFGQPIADFQMIQDQIAQMSVEIDAARLLVRRAAWNRDQGARNTLEVSMAKYFAAEAANNAAGNAMKIHGSYGYSSEYPVERYFRDAKSFQVVEGTSNIQKIIIAGYALGKRK